LNISGTGHRPDKLGGYSPENRAKLIRFAVATMRQINSKYPISIMRSGMALGWDQAIAMASIDLGIPYDAYIPFEGFESKWPEESRKIYHALLNSANKVVIVGKEFSLSAYQRRNETLVDNCDLVLALWNGSCGGTQNCIQYANKVGKKVYNTYEYWRMFR
jgi:uncharacterized phage-like protein YoqJ